MSGVMKRRARLALRVMLGHCVTDDELQELGLPTILRAYPSDLQSKAIDILIEVIEGNE